MNISKAILTNYLAYKQNPNDFNRKMLEGHIYELFCYNKLLINNDGIKIVKSKILGKKEKFRYFSYSVDGKINYSSDNIHLAEFDVLGIKDNTIYSWEITKAESNYRITKNKLNRKIGLLNEIFNNYAVSFTLILPHKIDQLSAYNTEYIPEPDYNLYMDNQYFDLDKNVLNAISIKELDDLVSDFSFIAESIKYSKELFSGNINSLSHLKKIHIIEYLYDLKNITSNKFRYYDIQQDKYGLMEKINGKYYRNGTKSKGVKIKSIIKRLKDLGHCI